MSKNKKRAEGRRKPLPLRLTPRAEIAKKKLLKLLKSRGTPLSQSELLRQFMGPCLKEPETAIERKRWSLVAIGPLFVTELSPYLTSRFRAWAEPLVARQEVIVRIAFGPEQICLLGIWISHEYLLGQKILALEEAARVDEKSGLEKCVRETTSTVYLTGRERRAANRRLKRLQLKRTRKSGLSRLARLLGCEGFEDYLSYLEETPPPPPPNPSAGGTPNA